MKAAAERAGRGGPGMVEEGERGWEEGEGKRIYIEENHLYSLALNSRAFQPRQMGKDNT